MNITISDAAIDLLSKFITDKVNTAGERAMQNASVSIGLAYDRYTPMRTGALRKSKSISVVPQGNSYVAKVNYKSPYAKYQYENKDNRFKNYTTQGTGDHWGEKAQDEVAQIIYNEFIKQLQR